MRKLLFYLFALIVNFACGFGINKTVYLDDGETRNGSVNSVNGSIIIGKGCTVRGSSRSVNGRIEVGRESKVEDLQTVNGRIRVERDVRIDGDIESVNGSIRCRAGAKIYGEVTAINGRIELQRATVERSIYTTNGDVILEDNTKVKGDIVVEGKGKSFWDAGKLDIRISENSLVEGNIVVKNKRKNVRVYLSRGGKVLGDIRGAEVIKE